MAKVNFNNVDEIESQNQNNGPGSDVGFFTLKNDNDEAIVRFMCDSTDDFEILTVHDIQVGQRYRKVNCIRDPREPLDNCPLCKNGTRISNRFFIKLIQYDKVMDQQTGVTRFVPKAMLWERSTAYAKTLKSYIDNYGPLSDIICKIIRHGKAGDMQTTYEIVPNLSKAVYPDDVFVKDVNLFGDFEAMGTVVMNKNFEELSQFIITGEFPVTVKPTAQTSQTTPAGVPEGIAPRTYDAPPATPPFTTGGYVNNGYATTPVGAAPESAPPVNAGYYAPPANATAYPNAAAPKPWETSANQAAPASGFDRPRRY